VSYASVSDVAVQMLVTSLTALQELKATALLPLADRVINRAGTDIAARVAADATFAAVVRVVAASLVARALTEEGGATETQESIDDYSFRARRETPASEGMVLTDYELDLLAEDDVDATVAAFSVIPGGSDPYLTMPDPLGTYPLAYPLGWR
jgi:hypothetical protein